ncbi:MAG: CvpA family protein [bacterium]
MNGFDWIVIIIFSLCAYYGWKVGAIFSVIYLITGFLGNWLASNYYTVCADFFEPHPQAIIYGYLLVFIGVLCVMVVLGFIIHKFIKLILLGIPNRIAGLIIGGILGLIISAGIMMPLSTLNNPKVQKLARKSLFASHIIKHTQRVISVFPPKKKKIFQIKLPSKIKKIQKTIKKIPAFK